VCERVGNSLVMHAVLKPASAKPMVARSPAPPAPTTTASYAWSTTLYDREGEAAFAEEEEYRARLEPKWTSLDDMRGDGEGREAREGKKEEGRGCDAR